jgi:diadenosine tetraphosphate (Ap4A) HIT family hydrolase
MEAADTWQSEREHLTRRVEILRQQGICDACYDLETGGALYGAAHVLYEDGLFKVKLERYPRARGHTIVLYKPHRADLSELSEEEASLVFQMCVRVVRAIKDALSAQKVYLVTMCDGTLTHLHLQLLPRYPGEKIGSTRFVAERRPLTDGEELAERVRAAFARGSDTVIPF